MESIRGKEEFEGRSIWDEVVRAGPLNVYARTVCAYAWFHAAGRSLSTIHRKKAWGWLRVFFCASVLFGSVGPLAAQGPSLTGGELPAAVVGTPYNQSLSVTGGTQPFTWSVTGPLPTGLTLGNTGAIRGTPAGGNFAPPYDAPSWTAAATAGTTNVTADCPFTISVTDNNDLAASAVYAISTSPYSACASFSYLANPAGLDVVQSWTFQNTAVTTGTLSFDWQYSGFHAFFEVFAQLQVFTGSPANAVTLYSASASECCTPPSGGFNVQGTGTIALTQGQTFGFITSGSNLDSNNNLSGTLTISNFSIQPSTSTTLAASPNSTIYGQPVVLTGSVTPSTATGAVTFYDGATALGSAPIASGQATLSVSTLTAGTHPLSADYTGDISDAGSISPVLYQNVEAVSSAGLVSSPNPSVSGQPVTLTASVSPSTATGTVRFYDSTLTGITSLIGAAALVSGTATATTSTLAAGGHSLIAVYGGDANDTGSTSAVVSQTVQTASSTSLNSSPNPAVFGESVTLTATVSPSTATGSVTFYDASAAGITTLIGTAALVSGTAVTTTSSLAAGGHSFVAVYGGDANDAGSTSTVFSANVSQASTVTVLSSSRNPASADQSITFTASVSPPTASGTVTFSDGTKQLGYPVALSQYGNASYSTSGLAVGSHAITAAYSGDSDHLSSVSSNVVSPLSFLAATPGTVADATGQGTGFTSRLPGTGASITGNDANLVLDTSEGTLSISSTPSSLNGQADLGVAEFIGIPLANLGIAASQDFSINATFRKAQYSQASDQFGLFAGSASTTAFRIGALAASAPEAFTVQTVSGTDTQLQSSAALAPGSGDTVSFTLARTGGAWSASVQNLTTPSKSGTLAMAQPTYLAGLPNLVAGVYAGNPGNTASQTETLSAFSITAPAQIIAGTTALTLTSSSNPSNPGEAVTLTARVSPSSATGTVTFTNGSATLGNAALQNGLAAISAVFSSAGNYSLTASYSGDANDSPSSGVLTQTVSYTALSMWGSLPQGQVGVSYGPVTLWASGGSGTCQWSASGLPGGLNMSLAGTVSGTPTSAFNGAVQVNVWDPIAGLRLTQSFTLVITGPLTITGSGNLGEVLTGGTLSGSFSASGGTPPYSWSVSGGLSVDSSGNVRVTGGAPGSYSATLTVADSANDTGTRELTYSVFGITTTSLPQGTTAGTYSAAIVAAGGTGTYTFAISGLPAGLTASGASIGGRPSAAGTFAITAQASDGILSATAHYSLVITGAQSLSIASTSLPDGTAGQPYSQTLAATGGAPAYTWALSGGNLPAGLSLSSSGTVFGTPATPGAFSFGVEVSDTAGAKLAGALSITIDPAPLTITSGSTLPAGIAGFDYPAQLLTASGGTAPYTFAIKGSLPAGLTMTNATIQGTPTSAGTGSFTVVATDSSIPQQTGSLNVSITIRPSSADLVLSSGGVSFSISTGASAAPDPGAVTVASSSTSQRLSFSIGSPSASWFTVSGGNTTPSALSIALTSNALSLTTGGSPYTGSVTVTCTTNPCEGNSQSIGVTLNVIAPPPQLSVGAALLSFTASSASPTPLSQSFTIQNSGGGTLNISAVSAADGWVSVSSFPATVSPGPGVSVTVTVNPAALPPGFASSSIEVVTSAGSASIPVTLFISANSSMSLGPAGAQFSMSQGGALGNPNGSFVVIMQSGSPIGFTATVQPGASWLTGGGPGSADSTSPATVSYSIDPSAVQQLNAGVYYGTIRVAGAGIVNSPQDYQVVLSIGPAAQKAVADPEPAGLIFLSSSPGSLPAQAIQVYASSTSPLPYQASVSTSDGNPWLSGGPSTGTSVAGAPATFSVLANSTGLDPGVYRGTVTFASGATVRGVNITLIVEQTGSQTASQTTGPAPGKLLPRAAACTGGQLVATQTGLVSNFSAPAAWPTPLQVSVVDTCGNAIGDGQVVATFSNGDPPLLLALSNPAEGRYSGTWTPGRTSAQTTITARVSAGNYASVTVQIGGQVTPTAAPALTPNGTSNVFHPQVGAGLGPGNIVQIFGSNLANQAASAGSLPLPTEVNGTQAIIGGVTAPLFYVSTSQVNAQIPFELEPNQQYQVIVSANGALTAPQTIQLNAGAPAVLQFTSGEVVAQHPDGTVVSDTAPAAPGEDLTLYMTGLGATDITVPSGQPSPSSPPANVLEVPSVTLNGTSVPLLFAGLTPGLVGLYQVNIQIPATLTTGSYNVVVSQNGVPSNTTLLAIQGK